MFNILDKEKNPVAEVDYRKYSNLTFQLYLVVKSSSP